MSVIPVGAGNWHISSQLDDFLSTHALVSNVAIAVFDPQIKVGALFHYAIPRQRNLQHAAELYGQPGLSQFIKVCSNAGMDLTRVKIGVAGGAPVPGSVISNKLSQSNREVLMEFIKHHRLIVSGSALGEPVSSFQLHVGSGKMTIRRSTTPHEEIL
ncbi:hypothetical protein [Desulfurispira natronophila]|uniref:Chemotaxis receptor (MCP) glutamine deamidase CheD n=1 Tax=Desulfurispira natronophila TaxID=682562 RepID=A0A7W8DFY0_9BACT|nr:hypothetical protein [Desulfurispira natronophila]MBB5020896.1 chemotaxis receptor (MCP) glutamine deamidase CheD [Desulfurispira natronophila]